MRPLSITTATLLVLATRTAVAAPPSAASLGALSQAVQALSNGQVGVVVGAPTADGAIHPPGESEGPGEEGNPEDLNKLLEMVRRGGGQKPPTPEQQKMQILQQLQFDRSTAGILAARLEEARAKAAEQQAKPEPEAPKPPEPENPPQPPNPNAAQQAAQQAEMEKFQQSADVFRRDVVLGRWDKVREFMEKLPKEQAPEIYGLLVAKLSAVIAVNPPPELAAQGALPHTEQPYLPPAEVLALAAAAPVAPPKQQVQLIAKLVPKSPRPPEEFFKALESGVRFFGGKDVADRTRAAALLLDAGFVKESGAYLPTLDDARGRKDWEAVNLISRQLAEVAQVDAKAPDKAKLSQAWDISTSLISNQEAAQDARAEALFRALSLIPALGDKQGQQWLDKTFGNPDGEGLELLASLGILAAQSSENPEATIRLEQLRIQHAAVAALLAKTSGESADWSRIYTLFARQWAYEAKVTQEKDASSARRMQQQFDEWGNPFYTRNQVQYQGEGARPITAGQLLEICPDEKWLAAVEPSVRNQCLFAAARLYLKVKEENSALPLVKTLATTHRDDAVALVREVIRVWSENHNPNEAQDYRSRYFYFYGFNNQSGSIPLTRSKQERNLVELASLVKGIRDLKLEESFQSELADAFISCHSKAEVWRVDSIESVFGATDALDSDTLATLVGRMRLNLAGLWPNPTLQQNYQTKRKDKELQEQILQGYAAATGVLERALEKKPAQAWRLESQLAALKFEESNYRSSLAPDSKHATIKRAALEDLEKAAAAYAATLPLADASKESSAVFETWFFAALGSPTLEALKSHHVATPAEYPKIKAALAALPEESRERHIKAFATTIDTRLANVSPDLKMRYLEAAAAVAEGRDEMRDATAVLAYYRDLVKEIQLDATLDGPGKVGAGEAFGVRVNLRHTREIERESGGFQRYLQNQTNSMYGYNFGRPPEDYRDKFEKAARAALEEHFEVVSVTFHSDKVESRTDPQYGWRVTPYAYLMLKAKGPEVDRVPPLKIDLDFNDTSGYVVLPITSGEILIDASKLEERPIRDVKLTQTIDERSHAEKGSLYLEVKATGHGLLPQLAGVVTLPIDGFEMGAVEDRGLRITELDAASDDLAPVSEHEWRVELKPTGGVMPKNFHFPAAKVPLAAEEGLVMQRYSDVDLVPVSAEMPLGVKSSPMRPGVIAALIALVVLAVGGLIWFIRRNPAPVATGPVLLPLPSQLNAVSVIGYLRKLQQKEGISTETAQSLQKEIESLEAQIFSRQTAARSAEELEQIARKWQSAA